MSDHEKHEEAKRRQISFRLNIFFFSIFILFSVLIVQLAILQFVEGTDLTPHSFTDKPQSIDIQPIRGNIYDRQGFSIAYSTSTQSLYYRIEADHQREEVIEMAKRISHIIDQYGAPDKPKLSPEEVLKIMDVGFDIEGNSVDSEGNTIRIVRPYIDPRRIKTDLTQEEIAYILEHRDEFVGLEVIEESVRHYAEERIAVQLVGYLRPFFTAKNQQQSYLDIYQDKQVTEDYLDIEAVGFDGIEFMYQEELRGLNGKKTYPTNNRGQIVGNPQVEYPTKGNNLYLTIDKDIQLKTEQAILDHLAFMQSEEADSNFALGEQATTGFAVAMEVETGKVVAMASMPDYDPNVWTGGISQKEYEEVQFSLKNGTISEAYPNYEDYAERSKHPTSLVPLGSTIKPLTVLLGLKEGLITRSSIYNDPGYFNYGRDNNSRIRNSGSARMGNIGPEEAIRRSSNVYMAAMIGNPLYLRDGVKAIEVWDEYMTSFGLGVLTGSGLPSEITGIKEYMNYSNSSAQAALVMGSFGQQGRYTPLQLAQFAATLGSKGKRMKPQFVERITTANGEIIETFEPVVLDEVHFEDEHWDLIFDAMQGISKRGFEGFGHSVASKTGTSQQQVAGGVIVDNAVFIAFAPVERPKLAVAVVVPEGGFGGWGAAPIARQIFDAYDEAIGLDNWRE